MKHRPIGLERLIDVGARRFRGWGHPTPLATSFRARVKPAGPAPTTRTPGREHGPVKISAVEFHPQLAIVTARGDAHQPAPSEHV